MNGSSLTSQKPTPRRVRLAILAGVLGWSLVLAAPVHAEIQYPPAMGLQNAANLYGARFVPVYHLDFENGPAGLLLGGDGAQVTTDTAEVLGGHASLKLTQPFGYCVLPAAVTGLEPEKTYVLQYNYRIVQRAPEGLLSLQVVAQWSGLDGIQGGMGGPIDGVFPAVGCDRLAIRLPRVSGAQFVFFNMASTVIVDDITIYRHENSLYPARTPLIKAGFPRLCKYNLYSPEMTALRNLVTLDEVVNTLGLFDVVNGLEIDHTLGWMGGVDRLRLRNPNIVLLPYVEAFMAQLHDLEPLGGGAKLRGFFNQGLRPEWRMCGPAGNWLNEPLFPYNYQMNHTPCARTAEGVSFADYMAHFLSHTVFPSGRWDGVHFDQVEWYPNPLLAEGDPFHLETGELPPIDLDGDGQAESAAQLHQAWRAGFMNYFRKMQDRFGYAKILFGNPGSLPANPTILAQLNGWQREFIQPYPIGPDKDWQTGEVGGWFQLLNAYRIANQVARAPQVINLQFTGYGLGEPNGSTHNGLSNRKYELEARDYRRMRLGLGTALLGNGFFGYDYVDNTTPPVWFDEYAVDERGRPAMSLQAKGYLGQPLGEAVELEYSANILLDIDFEHPVPTGIFFTPHFELTEDPALTLGGGRSMVVTIDNLGTQNFVLFKTFPEILPLKQGQTYQFLLDYRLLEYRPAFFKGLLLATITDPLTGWNNLNRNAALFYPDIDGPGQQGTLRTAVKADGANFSAQAFIFDHAKVVIDNIRLIEGTGGVWRRDFERGIALVNPTPERIFVPQDAVAGSLRRTGIRRIQGVQDPTWNDGSAVTAGIEIPAGDGIILLADAIAAPPAGTPRGLNAQTSETETALSWTPASGTVSGYLIRYGMAGGDLAREAATGPRPGITLRPLAPGATYSAQVAAYDFLGRLGPFSEPVTFSTRGSAPQRPLLANRQHVLAPGNTVTLAGKDFATSATSVAQPPYPGRLAGTQVFIDGIAAPLLASAPEQITLTVPWEVSGDCATLRIEREGISSPDYILPVWQATPFLWTWDGQWNAIAFHEANWLPVSPDNPARPGDRLLLFASGVGLLEPQPVNGERPASNARPASTVVARIAGVDCMVDDCRPSEMMGIYMMTLTVPHGIPAGFQGIQLTVAGVPGNSVAACFSDTPYGGDPP